ncbi:MAG: helix-turn-helix domain-containing protein [Paludibacteraceae bacterium]|nr:helix-turn-helix domain-containing protein [Paludibacteraceae bacterium]
MDLKQLGNNIFKIRRSLNLTQESVALDLNISSTAYAKIERGETNVSFLRLVQIADCFNVDLEDLIKTDKDVQMHDIASDILQIKNEIHSIKQILSFKI